MGLEMFKVLGEPVGLGTLGGSDRSSGKPASARSLAALTEPLGGLGRAFALVSALIVGGARCDFNEAWTVSFSWMAWSIMKWPMILAQI